MEKDRRMLNIALLQLEPCGTLEENREKGLRACREAREMGADIALFPEMWSCGYRIYDRPPAEWKKEAIPAEGDFVGPLPPWPGSWTWPSASLCWKRPGRDPGTPWSSWTGTGSGSWSMPRSTPATLGRSGSSPRGRTFSSQNWTPAWGR